MKAYPRYATNHFDLTGSGFSIQPMPATRTETFWVTDVPREQVRKAVVKFLGSAQTNRNQALAELVELSRQGADQLSGMKSALNLLLTSGVHERTSAAIDFLTQLGSLPVKHIASTTEPINGKIGYVLVRALGLLGQREEVLRFRDLPDETVREAVAEALDNIGDLAALAVLGDMHANDPSEFIRRLAGELLDEH